MKNKLFHYKNSEELKTFSELKEDYANEVGADIPIPDDDAELILMQRLVQNGGNIVMINDKTLSFLHEFALHNESPRYLSKLEQMESIRNLYCDIRHCLNNKNHEVREVEEEELMVRMFPYPDEDDMELLNKLKEEIFK